jgi:drug/metabolite transporter (DMT)-like permease
MARQSEARADAVNRVRFRQHDARGSVRPTMTARIWTALLVVYVVWGSTYLGIRIAIETLPPFLMGAVRFLVAGTLLFAWAVRRGDRAGDVPGRTQWIAATIVGAGLFVGGNGGVVLAEQRIPSGVTALLVATLSFWLTLLAWLAYGERPSARALVGLPIGFAGMALLVGPVETSGIDPVGAACCLFASLCWAAASLYSRHAPLPARTAVSTGMQMIAGGACMLVVAVLRGELAHVDPARFSAASIGALVYLIVAGSLLAFSAYAWLLRAAPTSLVATYAYVNPVVAVVLGWAIAGEPVSPHMLVAGTIIVVAVALIASGSRAQSKRIESTIAPRSGSSRAKSSGVAPARTVTESDPTAAG